MPDEPPDNPNPGPQSGDSSAPEGSGPSVPVGSSAHDALARSGSSARSALVPPSDFRALAENSPEGRLWEILLFGFLGGTAPILGNHAIRLLTRTIPTLGIFDPVMIFGTAVFGLFGMAIARASGER